jgi:hypothetical protein
MLAVTDTGTGMDPETPSETICALSGIQFDPRLVAAFVSIPEKTWPATATNQQRVAKHHPPIFEQFQNGIAQLLWSGVSSTLLFQIQ